MADNVTMARAAELVDSWVNGNRKFVMEEIEGLPVMEAALMTGYLVHEFWHRLHIDPDAAYIQTTDFLRMIARRA